MLSTANKQTNKQYASIHIMLLFARNFAEHICRHISKVWKMNKYHSYNHKRFILLKIVCPVN